MVNKIVVIDPGHGGANEIGGSSPNNATSPSGVLEKNLTLRFAFLVRDALQKLSQDGGHNIKVFLTRSTDVNLGLAARAKVAKDRNADVFLCIHMNAFNGTVRGTETLISPAANNPRHAKDKAFAQRIQKNTLDAIRLHDPNWKNRGVKDQKLGVLNRVHHLAKTRACLLEIEFLDTVEVDKLLNLSAKAPKVRTDVADGIAAAILADLVANP